jgi:hypothetical protein
MSPAAKRFPYVARDAALGAASLAPLLPIELVTHQRVETMGPVDSGAAINVLPYSLGVQLGLGWNQQQRIVELSGNLATTEARVVVVSAVVTNFAPVRLAFAWAKSDAVSVILGQVNFFLEFDVCFFRAWTMFEVRPKAALTE